MISQPHKVAIFVIDGMSLFEYGIAVELFVNNRPGTEQWYETFVVAERAGTIRTSDGVQVTADAGLEALYSADKILVTGWQPFEKPSQLVLDTFRDAYNEGAELISFCTGAFAVAATGLLDNRRATTHWAYSEQFKEQFPQVELVEGVLFVNEERIATSAGSAAAVDLGLHVIRRDYGVDVANRAAQRMVVAPARNGLQRQYTERLVQDETDCLAEAMDWAVRNLSNVQLTINMIADVANLSRRSFDRNFRKVTGKTPNAWLIDQRLSYASELLESTKHSIENIAAMAGFGSPVTFRQNFSQRLGTSPGQFRKDATSN